MHKKNLHALLTVILLLFGLSVMAQQQVVTGSVVDAKDGSPLVGVTVVPRGSGGGTVTDAKGTFRLEVPAGTAAVLVSYVGYATREVPVTGGTLRVALSPSNASLNEVVVIGYGTQQKKDLTGSIATVDQKDFQKGSITSPDQLISGKISGVAITSNGGQPGAGSTIRIRGLSSLNGNNDPLIVIDGVPMAPDKDMFGGSTIAGVANPLSLIDPNDIASITVLKDASAAAIYGSRASSGVILITTKKGKAGKPKFNFNTSVGVSKIQKEVKVLSPAQFRDYVNTNGNATQKALLGDVNTDWQKEIYQTAATTNSDLSVSGSLGTMPYRVSIGYLRQPGVLKTDQLQRTSASVRLNPVLLDGHLKIDINLNGSLSQSRFANQGAISSAVVFDPTQRVRVDSNQFGGYFEWEQGSDPNPNAGRNPVGLLQQYNSTSNANRSFGNIQFNYSVPFLPGLHVLWNAGYDVSKGKGAVHVPANASQDWTTTTNHGYNSRYLQDRTNIVSEFSLNYIRDLAAIHSNINATAGYGYYNNLTTNYSFANLDSKGDTIPGSAPLNRFDKPENTLISYYGRLIYTYNQRYILTASLRTDGSSRFAPDERWGVFPAVAFAWRISEESFLKNAPALSDLKLRLSYGVTGNQEGIGNYGYLPDYYLSDNGSQYQFGNKFYNMYTPSPYVPDLTWEQTASTNIGVDYGFFDNRLSGSIDYYYKKTKNLLDYITIPTGSNFTNKITTNIGNMTSQGVEFSVNVVPVKNSRVTWNLGFNIAYNKIRITRLRSFSDSTFAGDLTGAITGATGQSIQIQSVGYTPFAFYVFKQIYDPKTQKPIEGLYEDLNRDGVINEKDQYRYKSPFAPVTMGFSTELDYGRWSISTALRASIGNYMYNNVGSNFGVKNSILNPVGTLVNSTTDIFNTGFVKNQYQSDYYIQNASFLKMDNLGIGYSLPVQGKLTVALSLHCQNVFTVTRYKGLDPEIYSGIDYNLYPRPRIYTLGVNLGF